MAGGPLWQTQGGQEGEGRRWLPIALGITLMLAAVAALLLFSGPVGPGGPVVEVHPYTENLSVSDVRMATATTFLGATVYYVDGMVHNQGDQTITGMRIEVTFRNTLGEVVQRDLLRTLSLVQRLGTEDAVDMSLAPIAPGELGHFRLTFDHISADWNRQYPELRVVDVSLR
jgi:hypothetical protein